jgi:surface protein
MAYMFLNDTIFNQPIGNWNVSKVTNMSSMFENTRAFNQPIGNWDVSKVTDMGSMFKNATAFNQSIGNWNVSNVTYMGSMFKNATTFNQPIGNWNVSKVTNMSDMFTGNTKLSIANYDSLLIGWYARIFPENPLRPGVSFSAGNAKFCKGNLPRSFIISTYGWTITDGGMDCSTSVEELESSKVKLYPNPTNNIINIEGLNKNENNTIQIFDVQGKLVITKTINEKGTIDLSELNKGVYVIKIGEVAQRIVKL